MRGFRRGLLFHATRSFIISRCIALSSNSYRFCLNFCITPMTFKTIVAKVIGVMQKGKIRECFRAGSIRWYALLATNREMLFRDVGHCPSAERYWRFCCIKKRGARFPISAHEDASLNAKRRVRKNRTRLCWQLGIWYLSLYSLRHELVDGLGVCHGVVDGQALGDQRLVIQHRCVQVYLFGVAILECLLHRLEHGMLGV